MLGQTQNSETFSNCQVPYQKELCLLFEKSGNFSQGTFAVKTLLGWILMGGKDQSKCLNFNFINASFDLEQFWNLQGSWTLPKTHPNR